MKNSTRVQSALPLLALAFALCAGAAKQTPPQLSTDHLVTFISGDIVAGPQNLNGTVDAGGKANLSGNLKATYNFNKWIENFNEGDLAAFQILREAQIAAGGTLTGAAEIGVDASAAVNSYIEVSIEVDNAIYTIKLYTCVDYPHTTVTETATSIVVSQTSGTACAYKYPVCAFANEGEDLVYSIQK